MKKTSKVLVLTVKAVIIIMALFACSIFAFTLTFQVFILSRQNARSSRMGGYWLLNILNRLSRKGVLS
jgi:uncharacterized membrane protein